MLFLLLYVRLLNFDHVSNYLQIFTQSLQNRTIRQTEPAKRQPLTMRDKMGIFNAQICIRNFCCFP